MREILFRGKSPVTKEWVYGDLFQHGEQRFIMTGGHNIEVDPESVGQFTGLSDENDVKIFEGDIIKATFTGKTMAVAWDSCFAAFTIKNSRERYGLPKYGAMSYEVIGNIHDNPELIEDGGTNEEP